MRKVAKHGARLGEGMSLMSERRGARRYDLSLPVMIRIPAHGFAETQSGRTRDISTRGLYFVIDQDVHAGSELDIMLTLPSEMTNGGEMRVKASPPSSNATTSCVVRRPLRFLQDSEAPFRPPRRNPESNREL